MPVDLMALLEMLGGKSQPPAMGGPPPPQGMPYPLGAQGGNNTTMAALAGIGMMQAMAETRKLSKAENTVGMNLDKPTQTSPMASGIGPADLQQRAQAMAAQQSPQGPGGMPGQGGPPGMPVMPPGQGPGPGQLMAMLAQMRGGGGM